MHIMKQVHRELVSNGWCGGLTDHGAQFIKRIEGFAPAGTVSNGRRTVTLMIDATGRWLARVDGGHVERDVDLLEFQNNPKGAIEKVLRA